MALRISDKDWASLPEDLRRALASSRAASATVAFGVSDEGPWISFDDEPTWKPLVLNYEEGRLGYRAARVEQSSELLKKAMGAKKGLRVVDATAGLGRDSLMLSLLGHSVVSFERHPALFALAWIARSRLEAPVDWELRLGEASDSAIEADVVYLDPMYPDEGRTAASRKDLQAVRKLAAPTELADEIRLWEWARRTAPRVVVKRPRTGRPLAGAPAPSHRLEGKSTRFDIYLRKGA